MSDKEVNIQDMSTTLKKVAINLVGLTNPFVLSQAFYNAARKQGWSKEDIKKVLAESKRFDYDHMLKTLISHCENAAIPFRKKKQYASSEDDPSYIETDETDSSEVTVSVPPSTDYDDEDDCEDDEEDEDDWGEDDDDEDDWDDDEEEEDDEEC